MKEIEIMKKIDHPNIIYFVDWLEDQYQYYLVMELASDGDLNQLI